MESPQLELPQQFPEPMNPVAQPPQAPPMPHPMAQQVMAQPPMMVSRSESNKKMCEGALKAFCIIFFLASVVFAVFWAVAAAQEDEKELFDLSMEGWFQVALLTLLAGVACLIQLHVMRH